MSSQKIEQTLCLIDEVEAAAAIGVAHPYWGEAVCVCVVGSQLTEASLPIINAFCKERLGKFEVPKQVFLCDTLPMTSTGKIRKVELRDRYKDYFMH